MGRNLKIHTKQFRRKLLWVALLCLGAALVFLYDRARVIKSLPRDQHTAILVCRYQAVWRDQWGRRRVANI